MSFNVVFITSIVFITSVVFITPVVFIPLIVFITSVIFIRLVTCTFVDNFYLWADLVATVSYHIRSIQSVTVCHRLYRYCTWTEWSCCPPCLMPNRTAWSTVTPGTWWSTYCSPLHTIRPPPTPFLQDRYNCSCRTSVRPASVLYSTWQNEEQAELLAFGPESFVLPLTIETSKWTYKVFCVLLYMGVKLGL